MLESAASIGGEDFQYDLPKVPSPTSGYGSYIDASLAFVASTVSISTAWTGKTSRGIGALEQRLFKVEKSLGDVKDDLAFVKSLTLDSSARAENFSSRQMNSQAYDHCPGLYRITAKPFPSPTGEPPRWDYHRGFPSNLNEFKRLRNQSQLVFDLLIHYDIKVYVAEDSDATEINISSVFTVQAYMRECLEELAKFIGIKRKVVQKMFENQEW